MSADHRTSPSHRAPAWLIGLVVSAGLALAGCGGASTSSQNVAGPGTTRALRDSDASSATQATTGPRPAPIVHLPPHWRRAARVALLIALHPSGGSPAGFEAASGWDKLADEHGFIVAYLGSARPAWKNPAHVAYISAQIDRIRTRYSIDPRRVYVTGFSAGAYISYIVGCRLSAKVTAIAAVSAGMLRQRCHLVRPVSELTIIGTRDIIPLSGTARFPAPATVTALWRGLDHCPDAPPRVSLAGPATEQIWSCADGSAVGYYIIRGGSHAYPGSPGLPPADPDSQYNASEAVWAFFAAHRSRG